MKTMVLALSGLMLLGACTSSGNSGAVRPLSADLRSGARIGSVELQNTPTSVSDGFEVAFETAVQGRLNECATGAQPLTLTVTLNGLYMANPAIALFAPSKSEISGVARLTDASGAVVGEYRIQRSLMLGGWVGAAMAIGAEGHMSRAFGEELCTQAFGD